MKICFIGDIVGNAGRRAIRTLLPDILRNNSIDCCIINAENSAHGLGVTSKIVKELESLGVDAVTLGNHTFSNSNFMSEISDLKCVVRPANITPAWRGQDYVIIEKGNEKLGIINLLGQIEMMPVPDSPFTKADELIALL
ncbi:MAG: YmdB family metallophosphoesterase, partial [Clostridiales bacterium]|nr:YmdB family metallophosphoesterase [Clostridiales bacterium]